jgi:hypothetical protein
MNEPRYAFKHASRNNTFSFFSHGKRGRIKKVVQFRLIEDQIYNLGFGDYSDQHKALDDKVVTDNGDMEKVLATIIAIIEYFFDKNPSAGIFLTGSTTSRTRLYQIVINVHYSKLSQYFSIYGFYDEEWHEFKRNTKYESFLIFKLL